MGHVADAEIMKRKSKKPAGFTLMEVVVAISLMSLVMVTVVEGMRLAANAWQRGEKKLDEHARLMAGHDLMSEQISGAAVRIIQELRGTDKVPTVVVAFYGTPSELRFCTRASWRGDHAWPEYMADYRVVRNAEGRQQLVITETGLTDDASVEAALQARAEEGGEAVGDTADQIEMTYLQPPTQTQPAQWVSQWKAQDGAELPRAVQVRWTRGREVQQATFPVAINHLLKVR
jgi:general secretion pathway protein J